MTTSIVFIFYMIIILFVIIGVGKKKNQYRDATKKPFQQKPQQYSRPSQTMYNKRSYSEKDIFKSPKKSAHLFNTNHDVDCGLDERIFGPKNQHKDIF